jgi:hypothetical protein
MRLRHSSAVAARALSGCSEHRADHTAASVRPIGPAPRSCAGGRVRTPAGALSAAIQRRPRSRIQRRGDSGGGGSRAWRLRLSRAAALQRERSLMCRARSAREYPGDAELFEWVTQFLRLGFIILSGLPAEEGAILKLSAYYRARRAFDHMLRAAEFEIRFLLGQGGLLMMDNCRLRHGAPASTRVRACATCRAATSTSTVRAASIECCAASARRE